MMKNLCLIPGMLIIAMAFGCASTNKPAAAPAPGPAVRIDAAKTGAPISKYIYGQFIEHLGRCIYGGIWAEMLEDRKFFYAVGAAESPWHAVGPVEMIAERPFVGDHTPRLAASAGIVQEGLGLIAGKEYVGRVIAAAAKGAAPLEVSLVWGEGAANRQTIRIAGLAPEFSRYPLKFTAGAATENGRIEIAARGKGAIEIGAISLMPSDNVHGMRPDTLALLKELNAPIYRWPGGNFVSGYNWRDGIGDPDKRPPRKNPAWTGIEANDFGLDEFMAFCREVNTEPLVVVNSGLGDATLALEELEYANGAVDTPMGLLRGVNGHADPYGVVFWGIGNEMYGNWQLGHMPLEQYVQKHNAYAVAMRAKDPAIKLIAVGATGPWSETMLAQCAPNMDLLSEHFYCGEKPDPVRHALQIPEAIRKKVDAHRKYHASIPALAGKPVPICMDEWNFWYGPHLYGELGTRYFLKDALGIAEGLHEFYRASDAVYMANYAQTVNVIGAIKTTKTAAAFDTTGLVLKLYRNEFGALPVAVENSAAPVDVMAAWTADHSALTVGVVNPTPGAKRVDFALNGATLSGKGKRWVLADNDPMAFNEPGKAPRLEIKEQPVDGPANALDVPGFSVCLYRFEAK